MANPQTEDGFTPIANEILEALARVKLSPNEFRIIFFLLRKTYGWRKKSDWISLSQFSKGTGVDRHNVHRALKSLKTKKIIVVGIDYRKRPSYGFQKNYEKWKVLSIPTTPINKHSVVVDTDYSVLSGLTTGVVDTDYKSVVDTDYHKRKEIKKTKENEQNKSEIPDFSFSLKPETENLKPKTSNPPLRENLNSAKNLITSLAEKVDVKSISSAEEFEKRRRFLQEQKKALGIG